MKLTILTERIAWALTKAKEDTYEIDNFTLSTEAIHLLEDDFEAIGLSVHEDYDACHDVIDAVLAEHPELGFSDAEIRERKLFESILNALVAHRFAPGVKNNSFVTAAYIELQEVGAFAAFGIHDVDEAAEAFMKVVRSQPDLFFDVYSDKPTNSKLELRYNPNFDSCLFELIGPEVSLHLIRNHGVALFGASGWFADLSNPTPYRNFDLIRTNQIGKARAGDLPTGLSRCNDTTIASDRGVVVAASMDIHRRAVDYAGLIDRCADVAEREFGITHTSEATIGADGKHYFYVYSIVRDRPEPDGRPHVYIGFRKSLVLPEHDVYLGSSRPLWRDNDLNEGGFVKLICATFATHKEAHAAETMLIREYGAHKDPAFYNGIAGQMAKQFAVR